jgi:predicted metal-dependent hydrolase
VNTTAQGHAIPIRKIPFAFPESIAPVWNPDKPEWSHMVNGASLAMPYLEPFLVKNVREAMGAISDENLLADARAFVGQEAQHYTNHRRYNEMLKQNGYPELAVIEEYMAGDYQRLESKSLRWRLAYTAGFETMTVGLTRWLIKDRDYLFANSDPAVASLILWHMVEETEHKNVAIDIYQHLYGDYLPRIKGLFYAAFHVIRFSRMAYIAMLKRDGQWGELTCRLRLWRMATRFYLNVLPALLQSLAPDHHPGDHSDPDWIAQWAHCYAGLAEDQLPLLDTTAPGIPARFNAHA